MLKKLKDRNISVRTVGICLLLIFCTVFCVFEFSKVKAASIGDSLKTPETDWQRYDDTDSKLSYNADQWASTSGSNFFNGTYKYSYGGGIISFKFYGTKLRLIGNMCYTKPAFNVNIDGTSYSGTENGGATIYYALIFEKTDLPLGIHSVVITFSNATGDAIFDALDIDNTGYLVDQSATNASGISLNKTQDSLKVGDTDTLIATVSPDSATNKNVTWASSDSSIASVDSTGKVTAIKAGTATITATTQDESNLSASCSVTVTQPNNSRAILGITMVNNERKEYDLSMDDIQKFIDWYNKNTSPSYAITETSNIKPFDSRTDYLSHDKIASFEVKQYTQITNP